MGLPLPRVPDVGANESMENPYGELLPRATRRETSNITGRHKFQLFAFRLDVESRFLHVCPPPAGVFGDPGSTTVLGTHAIDASLVGRSCQVTVDPHNNDSIREDTDLLVASDGVTLTVANVEHSVGDAGPVVTGNVTLGALLLHTCRGCFS